MLVDQHKSCKSPHDPRLTSAPVPSLLPAEHWFPLISTSTSPSIKALSTIFDKPLLLAAFNWENDMRPIPKDFGPKSMIYGLMFHPISEGNSGRKISAHNPLVRNFKAGSPPLLPQCGKRESIRHPVGREGCQQKHLVRNLPNWLTEQKLWTAWTIITQIKRQGKTSKKVFKSWSPNCVLYGFCKNPSHLTVCNFRAGVSEVAPD